MLPTKVGSFGQVVSEENHFRNRPTRNKELPKFRYDGKMHYQRKVLKTKSYYNSSFLGLGHKKQFKISIFVYYSMVQHSPILSSLVCNKPLGGINVTGAIFIFFRVSLSNNWNIWKMKIIYMYYLTICLNVKSKKMSKWILNLENKLWRLYLLIP